MVNKKVLLIRNVAPEAYGGAEIYQIRMAQILSKNGFEPVIVSSSKGLLKEAKKCGFKTKEAPFLKRQNWSGVYNVLLPLYFVKQRGLKKWYKEYFEKEKPAVINVQSKDDFIAATSAAKELGDIRVLWTDHADFRNWVLINVKTRFKNTIGKWILKCAKDADKIIMISEKEKKWFKENAAGLDNIEVIQNGVIDEYNNYNDAKINNFGFCFAGRVVEEKGIKELVEAFNGIRVDYPEVTLRICGGDKDKEEIKKICGEGVDLGGVESGKVDDILPELAKNKYFILPSYKEGMSLALIEAMMMKKVIITTKVGAAKEMLGDEGGILVKAKDSAVLEKAMRMVLEEPEEAEKMAEEARNRYKEYYDLEEIFAKKMLPLYNVEKEK